MGKIYAKAILRGTRTLASVPQTWYAATVEALEEMCEPERFKEILENAEVA